MSGADPGSSQGSDDSRFSLPVPLNRGSPQKLRLVTDLPPQQQPYPAVSMVPTPLLPTGGTLFTSEQLRSPSQRNVSTSIVPDQVSLQTPTTPSSVHQNLLAPLVVPSPNPAPSGVSLHHADSLILPKRRSQQPTVQIVRSVSVGGPQRQPSTILHREPKSESGIDSAVGDVPEEVYLADDFNGCQTAWTRVRPAGKGSFSDVVLAKPAIQFIKPEFVDEVTRVISRELSDLDDNNESINENVPTERNSGSIKTSPPNGYASLLVAVKITTLKPGKEEGQLEFFKRDLEIMRQLPHHPSLMRLIGFFIDQEQHNRAIYVLPYCAGGDLFDLVAKHRSKLSVMLIRRLFVDVCSAVVFLHENCIVHRDIKLENVLLDVKVSELLSLEHPDKYERPLAVLTDMGLARRFDPEDPLLTTRCGSDDYVPPEIMLGQPYDGRETDSWALGVLLYAMMEGRLPFDAPPHSAHMDGNRARLRTAHRIARVDWAWHKRKNPTPEWQGGIEVVEGCLKRRSHRRLAKDTLELPWVFKALPKVIFDQHNVEDFWKLFVQ